MAEDQNQNTSVPKAKSADKADSTDWGQAEMQARADEISEQGYVGSVPDETPNENYSLQTGQDAPVPETQRVHPDKAARGEGNDTSKSGKAK